MRSLRTQRLTLDPVTLTNADALWRIMQADQLREYQDVPHYTLAEFRDRVAGRRKKIIRNVGGRFEWLIQRNDTGEAIGWISLRLGECGGEAAEMGYSLLEGSRGHGYATEGVWAVVNEALTEVGLGMIEAACVVQNDASRRVLERLGFIRMKIQRNGAVVRSRAVDIYIYRMDAATWKRKALEETLSEPIDG